MTLATEAYAALIGPVARFLLGEPNQSLSSKNELRFGTRGSMSIDLRKGTWFDHENQQGGGLLDLVAWQCKCETRESLTWLDDHGFQLPDDGENVVPFKQNGGGGPPRGKIVATYQYKDENDEEVLFEVCRFEPKDFRQRRPDGNGGYVWQVKGTRNVPYRLHELRQAMGDKDDPHPVFVVEGEKNVNILWRNNMPATCNAGGVGKWRPELTEWFQNADVIVIPDNDPQKKHPKTGELMFHADGRQVRPGQDHAHAVAQALRTVATRVRYLDLAQHWSAMPPKGDVFDWFTSGSDHTADKLWELAAQAPEWSPLLMQPIIPLCPYPIDEKLIPTRPWLVPGLFMRGQVTVIVAPPGIGKSLLTLQLGIACAQGIKWSGWTPRDRYKVLVINSEDDADEIKRRLAAAAHKQDKDGLPFNGMTVDQNVMRENLQIIDASQSNMLIAKFDSRSKSLVAEPLHAQIIETIKQNHFDLVFVDPFAETFEGDENSNNELKKAGQLWREVARKAGTEIGRCPAICLIHHTRKYASGMAGDVDAARGAGALIGIARIVSTIFAMTAREAETNGIKEIDRVRYLRYDDAKANQSLITAQARWFKKRTIELDNAHDDIEADKVGVLEPFEFKNPMLLEKDIHAFFELIDRGVVDDNGESTGEFYTFEKGGGTGERYIGNFAETHFTKALNQTVTLKQAEKYIKNWRKPPDGVPQRLFEIQYRQPKSFKNRKRVISEIAYKKQQPTESGGDENGELDFEKKVDAPSGKVMPFKRAQEPERPFVPPPSTSRFQILGPEPGTACVQCGKSNGIVYLIRDPFKAVAGQPLHENCAEAYFK